MANFSIPPEVGLNIARAKSLLRRDETVRALEALLAGLEHYDPSKLPGQLRFEAEVLIHECVLDLNRQPKIRTLLTALTKSSKTNITYAPKEEKKLKGILNIILKALHESEEATVKNTAEAKLARKVMLEQKGLAALRAGDSPKGKAALRVLADEFGEEPGVLRQVGDWLLEFKHYFEAAEFLEQAIERYPKDSKSYGSAVSCYKVLREFEKCEAIYLKAIRQFGKHTKTLTNLAEAYLAWNKKDKAYDAAREALTMDSSNETAKAIVEKLS
jgi:tetratricopeptide (TPR) repeat protein